MSPLLSLIIAATSLAAGAVFFWPDSGLFWKWRRGLRSTERVLIEDALKHLYDQEYKEMPSTLQSVAGALSISSDQAARLLDRLSAMGLVVHPAERFELTSEGRSYALRMIRVHRLWERYLADETGVQATEWHRQAEKLEHHVSEAEEESLAASLGHPSFDPHGDPIPTAAGALPPRKGQPLTVMPEGELAQVIHIEDEPRAIYTQLLAHGLQPGVKIRILEKEPERIHFIADGEEGVLAPMVAANVSVVPLPKEQKMEGPFDSLATLKVGEKAEVIGISNSCRGLQRRRLMDLGMVPGTVVSADMQSWSGDPTAYSVRGATIALRRNQAAMIHIRRLAKSR
ncbi:MAG TPA: iron dependent repressor, metal binding and dimerization domain protein [bacterium]